MRLVLFVVLSMCVRSSFAQSSVDYDLSAAEAIWAFSECVAAFGFGFIGGMKIKLVRKIEEMA